MQLQLLSFSPERLGVAFLLWMHEVSCGGVMRMRPGELRQTDITFGSFYGTRPALIRQELEQMMLTHHARWPQLEEAQDVYLHAAWVHAELVRIHPVWDGNGRLARTTEAWLCWSGGQPAPIYPERAAYYRGIGTYCLSGDLSLLRAAAVVEP